ncbi:unnamed protein product [Amoebophrya sp. A25]|nr:unnamed protein product [Amoebophrya sp. A25]|eukprot:GSA25T00005920001.1
MVGGSNVEAPLGSPVSSGPSQPPDNQTSVDSLLLREQEFYYNPLNHKKHEAGTDDGIRGRRIQGNKIAATIRRSVASKILEIQRRYSSSSCASTFLEGAAGTNMMPMSSTSTSCSVPSAGTDGTVLQPPNGLSSSCAAKSSPVSSAMSMRTDEQDAISFHHASGVASAARVEEVTFDTVSELGREPSASSSVRPPGLTVVLVGSNPASKVYVGRKQKACEEVGIKSTLRELPEETTPEELLALVDHLNADPSCDGILVQLPLPSPALQEIQSELLQRISPTKDVDGFHPLNLGCLMAREPRLRPCTPLGVMHLLWSTGVNPYGLRCLVVGVSNHVGRPMIMELLLNGCSVMAVHRFTRAEDLENFVREAECVIVAVGKPGIIKGEWIREGAIVIDVGINRLDNGKLVGDVDFDTAKDRASWITPVPGGVGPMTVAMLLQNTATAYENHLKQQLEHSVEGQC